MLKRLLIFPVCAVITGCAVFSDSGDENNKIELTYWLENHEYVAERAGNMNNTALKKELEKKTGVNLRFVFPTYDAQLQLTAMMAAGNLPDIIEFDWSKYYGGPHKAIEDGMIYNLSPIINEYSPNLLAIINSDDSVKKMMQTEQGEIFAYPFIRSDDSLKKYAGLVVRGDWLEQLGLEAPVTIDDWEEMLNKFKLLTGVSYAMTLRYYDFNDGVLVGAFGIGNEFYVDASEVKYGPIQDEYKDFLQVMARWYDTGLIDPFFATNSQTEKISKFINGECGAAFEYVGGYLGQIIEQMPEGAKVEPMQYPVRNKGDEIRFAQYDAGDARAAISTACTNVETAAEFLDYGYSEEGRYTYNFGIEGESYIIKDNMPVYTDTVLNDKEYSLAEALSNYIRSNQTGPFVQMKEYFEQYLRSPVQKKASEIWSRNSAEDTALPELYFSEDTEMDIIAEYKNVIEPYARTMCIKFIMGIEPIENFDSFREQLYALGIIDVLDVYNEVYLRYTEE